MRLVLCSLCFRGRGAAEPDLQAPHVSPPIAASLPPSLYPSPPAAPSCQLLLDQLSITTSPTSTDFPFSSCPHLLPLAVMFVVSTETDVGSNDADLIKF